MGPFYAAATNSGYMDWLNQYNTNIKATAGSGQGTQGTNQYIGRGVYGGSFVITPSVATGTTLYDGYQGSNITDELDAQIAAGKLPAPDFNTIYMLHFPAGYKIDSSQSSQNTSRSCEQFCAYHGGWNPGGNTSKEAYYSIIPNQGSDGCQNGCGSGTVVANTTDTSSHELIEAVTDAEVFLAQTLGPPLAWYDTGSNSQGETGDMCNQASDSITGLDGKAYSVQQIFARMKQGTTTPSNLCVSTYLAATDYSIYMYPNTGTVAGGGTLSVPITTKTTAGSPSALTLTVSGQPAGVTATVTSSVTSDSSATLTLTAAGGVTPVKDAVVVVKAVSGSNIHTAAFLLQVTGGGTTPGKPTVSISSPANGASVTAGAVTVTASASPASGTTLSTLALSIDGAQVASQASGTLSYSWSAAAGSHTLVATATDADGGTNTATSTVTVTSAGTTGFSLSVQSATTLVFPGKLASIAVSTSNTGTGAAPTISSFNVTGLPAGVTGTFAPSSVTAGGSTTLTLSASAGASASAAAPITITGTSGATTNTASGAAKVQVDGLPSVTAYAPTGGSVTGVTPVSMSATAGAGSTLSSLIVKLDGTQINFVTPAPGSTSASLNYSWNTGSVGAGSHTLTFTALDADGGTDSKTATITVTVAPPNDFSLTLSPTSRTISPGGPGATFTVTTAVTSGSAETITFSQAGMPAGLTAAFSPATVTAGGSTTLTVSAPAGTGAVPASTFTVLGKTPSVTGGHGAIGTITVSTGPKVTISSPAPGAVVSGMTPLNATAVAGANTTLSKVEFFDITTQPALSLGSGTASPASVVWDTSAAADGSHSLLVVATDATGATGSAAVTVTVANFTSSDFGITVTPASQTVEQGKTANYNIAVTKLGGPLNVNLFVSGLPAGLTGTLLSDTVASGSATTLQIAATSNASLNTSTFTISGTAVGNSHTGTGQVTVVLPGTSSGGMTVALTSPVDGATVSGQVTMTATASAASGNTLKRIDFLVDGQVVGSAAASPGSFSWDTSGLSANTYAVSAKAYDSAGNHAVSEVAVVTIPALTAPAAGCTSFGAPGALALAGLLALRRRRAGRRVA
jgi:hypothetical protein